MSDLENDENDDKNISKEKKISNRQLTLITCAFSGVQFVWALQNGNATAYFLEMEMSEAIVAIIWYKKEIYRVFL